MSFPSPSEYDDAIQNLSSAFIDAELKNGKNDGPLRFGVHGTVASGSFAIVYRIKCGAKCYAVKCFTSQPPENQRQRYSTIHDHLSSSRLKCSVGFEYLEDGVRVRGITYPILKMEWMEAPTLLKHLPTQLADSIRLRRLTDAFLNLSGELRRNKIAHGDLQHGNLLVSGDDLKIIDYDGMCVPGTNGFPSVENGLPPYQHPRRNGGKLNLNLDHFSSLVIWTSLHALSLDSNLWKLHIGDAERLLFQQSDFANPQTSQIFKKLLTYKDERLTKAVSALHDACLATDLEKIPHIEDVLVEKIDWWKPDETKKSKKTDFLPDWIETDQPVPTRRNSVTPDTVAYGDSPPIGDSWITTRDNSKSKSSLASVIRNDAEQKLALAETSRFDYGKFIFIAQGCVGLVICSALWQVFIQFTHAKASLGTLISIISFHIAGVAVLLWFTYLYFSSRTREIVARINSDYSSLRHQIASLKNRLNLIKENILADYSLKQEVDEMNQKLKDLQKKHKIRLGKLDNEFNDPITEIEADLNQISISESEALNELRVNHGCDMKQIKDRIEAIDSDRKSRLIVVQNKIEQVEREAESILTSRRLKKYQSLVLKTSAPIKSGSIEGWMDSVKKLHLAGIMNASDIFEVSYYIHCMKITKTTGENVTIPGISKRMTENLRGWLESVRKKSGYSQILVEVDSGELRTIRDEEAQKKSGFLEIIGKIDESSGIEKEKESGKMNFLKDQFKETQAKIKARYELERDGLESRKTACRNLYQNRYKQSLDAIETSINELRGKISKHERLIAVGGVNSDSLKKAIEQELAVKMQNFELLESKVKSHQKISFTHFLQRVFS